MVRLIILIFVALFIIGVIRGGGFCDPSPEFGGHYPPCNTPTEEP